MSSATRRSKRERKTNTLYDDQVAWSEVLPTLRAESDSPDRSSESSGSEEDQRRVDPDVGIRDAEEVADEAAISEAAESSDVATPDEDEGNMDMDSPGGTPVPGRRRPKTVPRPHVKRSAIEKGLRSRMLNADSSGLRLSKEKVWTFNFGPGLEDLYPLLTSRDVWQLAPRDVVLPSRQSINHALKLKAKGRYVKQNPDPNEPERELQAHSKQRQVYSKAGQFQYMEEEEAANRKFVSEGGQNEVILGPWLHSHRRRLKLNTPLNVTEAWPPPRDHSTNYRNGKFSVQFSPGRRGKHNGEQPLHATTANWDQAVPAPRETESNMYHRGWAIGLGGTPSCLAWVPCGSDNQYLAISLKCTKDQRDYAPLRDTKIAPAFSPSPEYPSHIQIWQMRARGGNSEEAAQLSHDSTHDPKLSQRLCVEWGDIMKFEWLPVSALTETTSRSIIVLTSDGNIRMITIDLSKPGTFNVTKPDLILEPPPHTVFSCFCHANPFDLITGGADGMIRLYDLTDTSNDVDMEPYSTTQVHNTYVMAVSVASDIPHFLASSSASGELILTDLRAPHQDRVRLHKARLPTRNLSYLSCSRTWLSVNDASGNSEPYGTSLSTVIGHNIRHFYQTHTMFKLPESSGVATVLESSPFHPFVLAANATGSVFASNVLRRILPSVRSDDTAGYMVKLFEVDWRALTDEELPSKQGPPQHIKSNNADPGQTTKHRFVPDPVELPKADIDLFHGKDPRPGLTRFHEHFRPERIELASLGQDHTSMKSNASKGKNKDQRRAEGVTNAASHQIIAHEEQAVTAMAWNPNARFCGWAAIGWGSGVLRIVDLSHG